MLSASIRLATNKVSWCASLTGQEPYAKDVRTLTRNSVQLLGVVCAVVGRLSIVYIRKWYMQGDVDKAIKWNMGSSF